MLGWPLDWRPSEILNPDDGRPFTPIGAWQFIADLLEDRQDIALESVRLDNPPGAAGYVMHVPLGQQVIYIKLQMGAGKIIGRSFHLSKHRREQS